MIIILQKWSIFSAKRNVIRLFLLLMVVILSGEISASCGTVTATFTPSQTVVCGSGATSISFINNSSGTSSTGATYTWYKDGVLFDNTSGLAAPVNSAISALGTYSYMLIAFDASVPCTDTTVVTVNIRLVPVAGFTFNNNNQCEGTTISFTNTSTGTGSYTTYAWSFGDGSTSTASNPTYVYSSGGTFNVSLTESNGTGCTNTFSTSITVLPKPVQNFTVTPNPGCTPQVVTFANTTTGAVPVNNFYWDFGNGNILNGVAAPPPQNYTRGVYSVMMVAGNACGFDTIFKTLDIDTVPKALMSVSSPIGCSPLSETIINNSTGGGLTYKWFVDGVLTSTLPVISPVLTAPIGNTLATHTIRLEVSNQCSTDDTTVIVTVHPQVFADISPVNSTICTGNNFTFTFTQASKGDSLNFLWNFDNGNTSTSPNPSAETFPYPATYEPYVIATGFCGFDTAFASLTVYPTPDTPVIEADTICAGTSATLTAVVPLGTCEWYNVPTGGTILSSGLTFNTGPLSTTTTFYVQAVVLSCKSSRTPVTVEVIPLPLAPTAAGATICEGTSITLDATAPGGIYQWYDAATAGTLLYTGASFSTPVLTNTTTYYVQSVVNDCPGPRKTVIVTVKPLPAAPTAASVAICTGGTASLLATAPGGIYQWFNAPTSGTLLVTAAAYTTPALVNSTNYYVQTIVNACPGPRTAVTVTVNPYPVADLSADVIAGCTGLSVNFTNNSTLGGSYNWTFSGAIPASSSVYTPPAIVFNSAGVQPVYITVTLVGCVRKDTTYISIDPKPMPAFTLSQPSGCSPVISALNNTSPVTIGDSYFWDFNNGTTSIVYNPPAQTFQTIGVDSVYKIKLIITGVNGCKDSVINNVTVHPNPVASFTPSTDTLCAGTTILFSNGSAISTNYQWSFGDLSSSTSTSPTHTYLSPNNYTAKLVAIAAFGCKDSIQSLIVVDTVPVAAFTHTTECYGFATRFTDASTGSIISRSWDFGDGSAPDVTVSPSHTYSVEGKYYVVLTVTNVFGCTHTKGDTVMVKPIPVSAFTHTTVCLLQATTFADQSSGTPISWMWDFGDTTAIITSQNPTHTYLNPGDFNVTFIAFGGSGCSDTITNVVTVNPLPVANFISAPVCAGHTMFFNDTSAGSPDTFIWNFGDAATDSTDNTDPTHVYPLAGTYNVKLTAGYSTTGCINSKTIPVTIFPHTVPGFTGTTPCLNEATVFTDTTTNSAIAWGWDFGDGSVMDSTQNPSHIYTTPATFLVTLFTRNSFGCTDSIKINTIVNPLPTAAFIFDTVCTNIPITFTDQSASAVSWNWDFADSTTSTNNSPIHLFPGSATYNVTLIVTNVFGCADTISHSVVVNPNPVAIYTASTACHTYPTVFSNSSTQASLWAWDFGDVSPIDTSGSPTHIYAYPGNYNCELTVKTAFGCSSSTVHTITVLPQPIANYSVPNICARDTIPFTDSSTGTAITLWDWNFGDGATDTLQHPTHIFQQSGNYMVRLIVTNSSGCADTIVKPLISNTVPTPFFTAIAGCAGTVASFTDSSTDAVPINSWLYNFDDGNTALEQNPDHIFIYGAGVYNVSLTVTNADGCDSSVIIPVTVDVVPIASYTVDTICIGTATTFTDISSGNPTSWHWTFGDGSTDSIGPVTSHLYATAGSFITSVTVSNGSGCADMAFRIIEVRSDVQAGSIVNSSACINEQVTMNDNSVIAVGTMLSASWDFGDGSPVVNTLNASHIYTVAGTYVITHVVVSDGGCANTALDTIIVDSIPMANFSVANSCMDQLSSFTDNTQSLITSWNWYFGDGDSIAVQHPTHLYLSANNFNVTLIVTTEAGCADSVTNPVTVYPKPNAAFSASKVCLGEGSQFVNTSTLTDGLITGSWWDFGDGTNATTYNAEHILAGQSDSFNITLAIITSYGCVDTLTQLVTTYPLSVFNFTPYPASGCDPFSTTFNDSSTVPGGAIVNLVWNFGDGNLSNLVAPVHTYDNPGNYFPSLTLTNSYGCQVTDTLQYPIVVYPTPDAGFTASPSQTSVLEPEIQFSDNSTGASFWNFDFGDNETSISQSPSHIFPDTGTFTITQIVRNQFGCSDTLQRLVIIDPVINTFIPNAFTPNGNSLNEVFKPKLFGILEFGMFIYDRWGKRIFETRDMDEGWNGRFEGFGDVLPGGVYVYKIYTKDIFQNNHTFVGRVTLVR